MNIHIVGLSEIMPADYSPAYPPTTPSSIASSITSTSFSDDSSDITVAPPHLSSLSSLVAPSSVNVFGPTDIEISPCFYQRFSHFPLHHSYATNHGPAIYLEPHPGYFDREEFTQIWNSSPVNVWKEDVLYERPERHYRGIAHRITINPFSIHTSWARGTVINYHGEDHGYVKYIVLWSCSDNPAYGMVRVNAFLCNQGMLYPFHHAFPALLMIIPRSRCNVPFSPEHRKYVQQQAAREKEQARLDQYNAMTTWEKIKCNIVAWFSDIFSVE